MKNSSIFYICLFICLQVSWNGYTQINKEKLKSSFTLSEVIEYALLHNKKNKNASLAIQAAEKQKWETIAVGLPQIDAKLEYQRWFKQQFPGFDFNGDGVIDIGAKQNITPTVTLTQLIFDGTYLVGLQSSKVFLEISKHIKTKTNKEVEKAVVNAYNNVLLTKESVKILQKNIKNIESNLTDTRALLDNGFIEEEDVEQLELTLNDLNNNLDNLNNIKEISKNLLKLLMGYDSKKDIEFTGNLESIVDNVKLITTTEKPISVFKTINYKIAENNTEIKRLLYKLEVNRKLPTIGAFVSANYIGNSNSFTFFENDQNWSPTSLMGITIDIPIFSSFRGSAKRKRAKIDWNISKNELENTLEEQTIKIQNIKNELEFSINNFENKKKNLALAERIEQKNNVKYIEGIATSFELRQAQVQLYSSQQEYLQAMVNVINKKAELNALKE